MNTFKKFTYAKGGKPILVNMKHVSSISSDNDGHAVLFFVGDEEGVVVSARFDALEKELMSE